MPTIESLLEKKKFKKTSYRPWNYMDEIEKEEGTEKIDAPQMPVSEIIVTQSFPMAESSPQELGINKVSIGYPLDIHTEDSALDKIFRLSGHQKKLFLFIVDRAISRGLLSTGHLTNKTLADIIDSSTQMAKTTLHRLIKKYLIIREKGKRGNGGFYSFCITETIRNAALEFNRRTGAEPLGINKVSIGYPLDIKIEENQASPQEGWETLDIEPLEDIGFTKDHVNQLGRAGGLDPQVIQNSIYHFAFDLKYNNKKSEIKKSTPLGYFMGAIRKFGVYTAPSNYESEKEKQMRLYYEQKKVEHERLKKVEDKLIDIAYQKWVSELSSSEKDALLPDDIRNVYLQGPKEAFLRSYFKNNIYRDSTSKSHL